MDRLAGRAILITGTTGIAAATAERAAAEGASVFVVSRNPEHAQALGERLPRGAWAAADLTDEAAVDTAVSAAVERFGRIDGLFSAAGGSGRRFGDGPIHALTGDAWEATAALNLRTQVLVCSRVVRAMREQRPDVSGLRGSILILGSITTEAPVPELFGTHAYAAAKGALTALMTSMAATYITDRIRVNVVAPSLTATPMAARAASDARILEYAARKQPLARPMLDPDEVAKAAIYFLSDESRAVTGQSLAVDGGWSIVSTSAEPAT
jgi:NAD(P)-dependent dehydrogenase (short-subunit alcohol dehydrogenase family)